MGKLIVVVVGIVLLALIQPDLCWYIMSYRLGLEEDFPVTHDTVTIFECLAPKKAAL